MTLIELECGCTKTFPRHPPQVGNLINCRSHGITAVASETLGRWTVQCLDCQYRRYPGDYGGSEFQVRVPASKHMTQRRHVVYSYRIGDFNGTHQRHAPNITPSSSPNGAPPF